MRLHLLLVWFLSLGVSRAETPNSAEMCGELKGSSAVANTFSSCYGNLCHTIMHFILIKIIRLILHHVSSTGEPHNASTGSQLTWKSLQIQTRYIDINNINNNVIVRIWLYKVLHSPDGKKLRKASETNTTGQRLQNIKVGKAGVLLARGYQKLVLLVRNANKANKPQSRFTCFPPKWFGAGLVQHEALAPTLCRCKATYVHSQEQDDWDHQGQLQLSEQHFLKSQSQTHWTSHVSFRSNTWVQSWQ